MQACRSSEWAIAAEAFMNYAGWKVPGSWDMLPRVRTFSNLIERRSHGPSRSGTLVQRIIAAFRDVRWRDSGIDLRASVTIFDLANDTWCGIRWRVNIHRRPANDSPTHAFH